MYKKLNLFLSFYMNKYQPLILKYFLKTIISSYFLKLKSIIKLNIQLIHLQIQGSLNIHQNKQNKIKLFK
jgi:hypothetical protein